MNYRNMTQSAGLAIATQIRFATFDRNRSMMERLSLRHGGIKRITKVLVTAGFMTNTERKAAINMMPCINNPATKIKV